MDVHAKTVNILPLAKQSMRENSFLVCSVCDEIVSSYAQCVSWENHLKFGTKLVLSNFCLQCPNLKLANIFLEKFSFCGFAEVR